MSRLKTTIIRDYGGGLNVVDDDLNLSSKYQVILDNVHRGVDNTLNVRWGTELFADLRQGSVLTGTATFTVTWALGQRSLVCDYTAHGLQNGDHVTFTSPWANMFGIHSSEVLNVPLGVRVSNANQFSVYLKSLSTAASSDAGAKTLIKDTHFLAGDIIEIVYYSDHLVVFDTVGEAVRINAAMTVTKLWDASIAYNLPAGSGPALGPGWTSPIDYVSTAIFKGKLIAVNGIDKPLEIDFSITNKCVYLSDQSTFDNHDVPICRYICAIDRWLIMAGDPLKPYKIHISATDSQGTWEHTDDATNNDGTGLELNNTNSSSLYIRGINKFRNFLAVAFDDTVAMVELGIFDGAVHKPETTDSVARHGAIAHKSMVFLGFDLVMADPIGVPSFRKSQFDNSIIPSRMSEFIAPMVQQNISRLTPQTLERDIFSVYSTHDNRYILFVPNHDNIVTRLGNDPIYYLSELVGTDRALLHVINHGMEEGDQFTLTGTTGNTADIPSTCIVDTVVTDDILTFRLNNIILAAQSWGGAAVDFTSLKTETTAYALTYNRDLKIKAWSRYRGWNFKAGCVSLYGRVFLAAKGKVWRMGNRYDPIYADFKGEFDANWANNVAYVANQRIKDTVTNEVYICLQAHTSASTGTFAANRNALPDAWQIYAGKPINFAVELPWADFDKRDMTKIMKTINVDAKGRDRFTVQMYLDYFYKHKITGDRTPLLSMDMVGGDKGAYGVADQTYGTGRLAIRQRPWPFEARGKLFKLRIVGASTLPLRFVAFIFGYKIVGRDR